MSSHLLSEQAAHALENAVLLGVVRVVLAGDFEDGGERIGEGINPVTNALGDLCLPRTLAMIYSTRLANIVPRNDSFPTHMLVDQQDSNVLSVLCELLEMFLDL